MSELPIGFQLVVRRARRALTSPIPDSRSPAQPASDVKTEGQRLPEFAYSGGLRSGVDLYDKQLMAEILDGDEPGHAVL